MSHNLVRSVSAFVSFVCFVVDCPAQAQKPAALPAGIVEQGGKYISQSDGAEMIYVPPGECIVGLAPGFPGTEGGLIETGAKPTGNNDLSASQVRVVGKAPFQCILPATNVFVNGFFIDKFEVSNRRYKKFMDATKKPAPVPLPAFGNSFYVAFTWPNNSWYTSADPVYDGADYPVTCVTWDDAMAYAKWAGKTLPTEVQWEKAARGTNGVAYAWGDAWNPDHPNTAERGDRATRPCGASTNDVSAFGVMDLAGNVSEWTADEWSERAMLPAPVVTTTNEPAAAAAAALPATNPPPATPAAPATTATTTNSVGTNLFHVIKGGNWGYIGFVQARGWHRRSNADEGAVEPGPVPHSVGIGFRCVVPAP